MVLMCSAAESNRAIPIKSYSLLVLPASFDMLATLLSNIGLVHVTVSVYQLVKCTVIVFVALFKVFLLGYHLRGYMRAGIALNMLAAFMVGATSLADTDDNNAGATDTINEDSHPGFGILMIVLGCAIQAAQYVLEEKMVSCGLSMPLFEVVGMVGVWGLILTSVIVYPIAYLVPGDDLGSNERFDDAYEMLRNSSLAQAVVLLYLLVMLGYKLLSILVTYLLNSIWRAILDNFRPITVWATDLLLFYVFTSGRFGEAWTIWSWLQLGGMITLLIGTAIYNGTIKLPGLAYFSSEVAPKVSIAAIESLSSTMYANLSSPREKINAEQLSSRIESRI